MSYLTLTDLEVLLKMVDEELTIQRKLELTPEVEVRFEVLHKTQDHLKWEYMTRIND